MADFDFTNIFKLRKGPEVLKEKVLTKFLKLKFKMAKENGEISSNLTFEQYLKSKLPKCTPGS